MADHTVSFVKDIHWLDITKFGALVLFVFVVMSMSNAVNLTDGLDGLATGTSVMVIGSYALIAFWQYRHWDVDPSYTGSYSYEVRDPLEIAIIAGAARPRLHRLPVVEHLAGPDLHGRHRRARRSAV